MVRLVSLDDDHCIALDVEEDRKEAYIGIFNEKLGCWTQDLIMVRPSSEESEAADIFIWDNPDTDDWVEKIIVGLKK